MFDIYFLLLYKNIFYMINKVSFWINKVIILSIFFIFSFYLFSCQTQNTSVSQQEKKIEKEKKKRQKDDTILYQKAVKQQMNNQTAETKEAMKDAEKQAKLNRENKKEFFLKRWINNWQYKQQHKPPKTKG